MSTNFWHRASSSLREHYRRSTLASYGAGLHTDCDDCAVSPADIPVPTPRVRPGVDMERVDGGRRVAERS